MSQSPRHVGGEREAEGRHADNDFNVPGLEQRSQSGRESVFDCKTRLIKDQRSDGRFAIARQYAKRQRQLPSIGEGRGVKAQMPICRVLLMRARGGKGLPEFVWLETHAKSLIQ